ncbi:arylamine N-acetyltransferase family protein [Sphingopyxis alaskensis]|jgi:N-hydroxyarylamine O-acetyltransferase|uniref:Arylamine N-acetyltransferase n=1 Tax=Sphingopyxis alaskensis (strain DSM 13593 / LMG 18877 / RB2256) TaxID=317655 RepID=Q1GQJ0_SPHAL|nr:arylamine N-acetyltransferase [Sphingopyxis alaskensis]ABF54082.1 Arylamine N-acetyltransferase [Sphingopyxis alaskensis RB2256]MCM3418842.1 arylamine N-acetyltransferase [Sphingopyxis alaskensis]
MLHQPTAAPPDTDQAGAETAAEAFLPRYLARIGYRGALVPTLDVLAALQAAHIAAIPFEAIDALTGAGVDIGAAAVEAKLIGQRRGGYCFEQNGLFLRALRVIGFDAEGLIGRVRWMLPDDAPPTPRSHMVLRVRIDGRAWLADVGFGAAVPPQPLAMDDETPQPTRHESYRIVRQGAEWQVAALVESEWRTLYRIEDAPPPTIDYEVGNWYTSAHPDSHFRHQLIAARTTAEARYGLRDNRLTTRLADGRIDRRYLTADEIERVLAEIFLLPVARHWRPAIERAATAEIAG